MKNHLILFLFLCSLIPVAFGLGSANYVIRSDTEIELSPTNKTISKKDINIESENKLVLEDASGGQSVSIKAPNVVAVSKIFTLPDSYGTANDSLIGDGAGLFSFSPRQTVLTNSAGLAAALSDETGSGPSMFGSGPTSINQRLDNPMLYGSGSSGGSTSECWKSGGSGTGGSWGTCGTSLTNSADLASTLSDETGSGPAMFGSGPTTTSPQISTQADFLATAGARFQDTTGGQYAEIKAPGTIATNWTLTLPTGSGSSGYYLQTDGTGVTSWAPGSGSGVTSGFKASIHWPVQTCTWTGSGTGGGWRDFGAQTSCDDNALTYKGDAIADASNPGQLPQLRVAAANAGHWDFIVTGGFYDTGTTSFCQFRISDGTISSNIDIVYVSVVSTQPTYPVLNFSIDYASNNGATTWKMQFVSSSASEECGLISTFGMKIVALFTPL